MLNDLLNDAIEFRLALNEIERQASIHGSTREDRWDWIQCSQGYQNIVAELTKIVGNENEAIKLINIKMN